MLPYVVFGYDPSELSEIAIRVPDAVLHRGGLYGLSGAEPLARRIRLPALREEGGLRTAQAWPVPMQAMRISGLRHRWHGHARDSYAVGAVVPRGVPHDDADAGDISASTQAPAWPCELPDRVDDAP